MFVSNMKYFSIIVLMFQIICQTNILLAENNSLATTGSALDDWPESNIVVLHLDENMNRILFDLFVEVFGNNPNNNTIEVPVKTVAEIYRNYTQEQLDSIRQELKKLDQRFDMIRKTVDSLQERFLISNIEYSLHKDLSKYEKQFIQIGEQLITLQKLVLKFTSVEKPIDENSIESERTGRKSTLFTIFDRLGGLLLGTNIDQPNYQNSEPLNGIQLNKIIGLMSALQSIRNVSTNGLNNIKSKTDLLKLQTMLYRLQAIQELNRLANQRQYLASGNMNPYRYEAVLNLVKLVGTASGQNQLRTILRLFSLPQTHNRVKNTNNLSQEKLKLLMKAIEEQETKRRQELENQRQKQILNELLINQSKQQKQINDLIKLIENKHISSDRQTTTQSPLTTTRDQNEILSKLREQRRQLNNLLKTLGSDFSSGGSNPNVRPNLPIPPIGGQNNNNFGNTKEAFTQILQSIGPMLGMLAQTGVVSPNQNIMTQKSLSELLNQSNYQNRIQYDSYRSKASQFIDLLGSLLNIN